MLQPAPALHFAPGAIRPLVILALVAMFVALFNYNWQGNGIHNTEGALIVVVSTALLALASMGMLVGWIRGALRGVIEILILLDFAGTALAGYLLEAWGLLAVLALAFAAWVMHVLRPTVPPVHR